MKNLATFFTVILAVMINAVLVGPTVFATKIGISQIIGLLCKMLPLIFLACLILISILLYKQLFPVHGRPVSQPKEPTQVIKESRSQNSNFNDAICRINYELAGEPGFVSHNDFSVKSGFEITELTESDKREFISILDQFWSHLFDLNGNLVEKAKIIRADVLLRLDVEIDREYYTKRNIHTQPDFTKVVWPSTKIMPNSISSATLELRDLIRNSFLDEEKAQLDDYKIVTLVMRAARSEPTCLNTSILDKNPVFDLIGPFIQTDSCWSFRPSDREDKDNETIGFFTKNESKFLVLHTFCTAIKKLVLLDGCSWLFKRKFSYDEGLIGLVASSLSSREKEGGIEISDCGSRCTWRGDLILSFGVWAIYRILELLLVETRPEFWGEFAFLLCRLQGIIAPALLTNRFPLPPCFCFDPVESVSLGLELASKDMTGGVLSTQFMRKDAVVMMVREVMRALLARPVPLGNAEVMLQMWTVITVLKRYNRFLSSPPFRLH